MTRQQLKENARAQLGNRIFGNNWLYAVLVVVILGAVTSVSNVIPGVGALLVTGPLYVGINSLFLKQTYDGQKMQIADMFNGFKNDLGENILLGLMITIFTLLWSCLFIIPGIIMGISYSMAYFVKADHPDYGWKQCIDESKRIMQGHKLDYFILQLSFIGWMFIGSFCVGVGMFWVTAYMTATNAQFYRSITAAPYVPLLFST